MTLGMGVVAAPVAPDSNWLGLLAAIVRPTIRLPGAACRGLAPRFDVECGKGRRGAPVDPAAVGICQGCAERLRCGSWAGAVPAGTVSGVLGGVARTEAQ